MTVYSFDDLSVLSGLESLTVNQSALTTLAGLQALPNLTTLNVAESHVVVFDDLAKATTLESLQLDDVNLTTLSPIYSLTNLTHLTFWKTGVTSLTPLRNLTSLEQLSFFSTPVADLSPLAGLANLTKVILSDTAVTDLTPLIGLPKLTDLSINSDLASTLPPELLRDDCSSGVTDRATRTRTQDQCRFRRRGEPARRILAWPSLFPNGPSCRSRSLICSIGGLTVMLTFPPRRPTFISSRPPLASPTILIVLPEHTSIPPLAPVRETYISCASRMALSCWHSISFTTTPTSSASSG